MTEELVDFVVVAGPLAGQSEALHIRGVSQPSFRAQPGKGDEEDDDEGEGEGDGESDDDDEYCIHARQSPRGSADSAMDVPLLISSRQCFFVPQVYSPCTGLKSHGVAWPLENSLGLR